MLRKKRKLNKYERAYFKKIRRLQKNRLIKVKKRKKINLLSLFNFKKKKRIKKPVKLSKIKKEKKIFDIKKNIEKKTYKKIVPIYKIKEEKRKKTKNKKKYFKFIKNNLFINLKNKYFIFFLKTKKQISSYLKKIKINLFQKKMISNKQREKKKNIFYNIKIFFILIFILILFASGALFLFFSSLEIPSVDNFAQRKISNSTKIFDRTGKILLYDIHKDIQRTVVPSDKISKNIKNAIVAIEDHSFYEHNGVVWKSTIRAVIQTLFSKIGISTVGSAGGSTLTQQMVKNTLLTREKTIKRKMKEWVLAYKIEKKLSKDEILTTYLNEAPYGGTIYGVQEASMDFFGKPAFDVTVAEAAYLAAIPNLPTYYSPYGPNKDKLDERQKIVLKEMKKYHYISDNEYRKALLEKVIFIPKEEGYAKALHFVQYVRSLLEEKYGLDMVENGGLQVVTTLDYTLQKKAESVIKKHIEEIEKKMDASNSALVAIETKTGNIITMVGSRDYFDTKDFDGNFNVAISPRQPGSSFKPLVYASAFEKGYLPESSIFDTPTEFNSNCTPDGTDSKKGCYFPGNWDNQFKGAISFRNALAQSRNIPAIKVLYLTGVSKVIKKAQSLGITSLNKKPSYYGLNLVLGGGEVSLLEMVSAYTAFANKGKYINKNAILKVSDVDGNVLYEQEKKEKKVFSENTVNMISSILSDNTARTPLYGAYSGLYFGNKDVAGKTGTTNDKRDAWMIGYTTDVAVGVWTGNNDNSPMKKGSKLSIKPWHKFMQIILDTYKNGKFEDYSIPENFLSLPLMVRGDWKGGDTYIIDSLSGKLATEFTPEENKVKIQNFNPHTILHSIDKYNPQKQGNSQKDPQYKNWEYGVQKYANQFYRYLYQPNFMIPTEYDDVHGPGGLIEDGDFDFSIKKMKPSYKEEDTIRVKLSFRHIKEDDIKTVLYYINNSFTGSVENEPFDFQFNTEDIQYLKEENILRIIVEDKDGKKVTKEKEFKITPLEE